MPKNDDYNWKEIADDLIDNLLDNLDDTDWSREQLKEGYLLLAKVSPSQAVELSNKFGVPYGMEEFETRGPSNIDKEQVIHWLDELEPADEVLEELRRLTT